jgi:hypothetical protein
MADETKREETLAEALGRKAGRLMKTARPRLEEAARTAKPRIQDAATAARPHIEKAVQTAAQYAREHEEELKQAATGVVKSRLPLPLRGAVDAVVPKAAPVNKVTPLRCSRCGQENPAGSRFCNQCGATLAG